MLAYEMKGKGMPVVLLHAFPLSSQMWEDTACLLSTQYQVIVPDLPGFGKSPLEKDVSMEAMARKTEELLDHLNIHEPVWLAGLSMGGYAAFEFLRHFPKRLGGLALFSTRATADTPAARENRFKSIEAMEKFGIEAFARKAVKSQLGKTTQEKNPELIQKVLQLMTANSAEGAIAAQKAMASRRDSSDLLAAINIPVLILAGEEDEISPASEMKAMHEKIKGSEFQTIPRAGHLIHLEQPEIFHEKFQAFLKKCRYNG